VTITHVLPKKYPTGTLTFDHTFPITREQSWRGWRLETLRKAFIMRFDLWGKSAYPTGALRAAELLPQLDLASLKEGGRP